MQVFEPFEIQQFDVIVALKKYGIIEQDRPELANYTREESIALKDILYNKFEQIDFDMKVYSMLLMGHCHIGVIFIRLQNTGLKMLKTG